MNRPEPATPQISPSAALAAAQAEIAALRAENAELAARRRFGLVWEDRPESVQEQMQEMLPVLRREPSLDVDGAQPNWDRPHLLIEGDNLHALTAMQATHKAAIDVIYIDPPYNTGSDGFVYNDRLVGKDDEWRHSAWVSFMDKRLTLARELMRDTGVVFISIDDNQQAHLRVLCNQVFGEANFIAQMVWQKKYGGGNDSSQVATEHEYVLVYGKQRGAVPPFVVPHSDDYLRRYREQDDRGRYFWDTLARPGLTGAIPVTVDDGSGPVHLLCGISQQRANAMTACGEIKIVRRDRKAPSVLFKQRLPEGKRIRSLIQKSNSGVGGTSDGKKDVTAMVGAGVFSYPKPSSLIVHLLRGALPCDGVVLDFFAGSGTTAHAVAQLNAEDGGSRQCILVTNNENGICRNVTQPRVKAVLSGVWADGKPHEALPGSLRFLTTGFIKHTDSLGRRISTDALRRELAAHSAVFVGMRENTHEEVLSDGWLTVWRGGGKTVAVAAHTEVDFEMLALGRERADSCVRAGDERVAYVFTTAETGVDPDTLEVWAGWDVRPLPRDILAALRRATPRKRKRPPAPVVTVNAEGSDEGFGGLF